MDESVLAPIRLAAAVYAESAAQTTRALWGLIEAADTKVAEYEAAKIEYAACRENQEARERAFVEALTEARAAWEARGGK